MRRSLLVRVTPIATSLVLLLSSVVPAQVEESLDGALNSFRAGNFGEAQSQIESLFRENPTNDAILDLLDKNRMGIIIKMVSSDDSRMVGAGLRLLELRRSAVKKKISDSQAIQDKIAAYLESESDERLALKSEIAIQMGRNAVVYLIDSLGAANVSVRADAMLLISEIGLDAVPVLMAAAEHSSPLVQSSVAKLLGSRNLRHPSVAGTLASLIETSGEATVREAAEASLRALNESFGSSRRSALEYHYANAQRFYLFSHSNPYTNPYYEPTIYELVDDQIQTEQVASFQLSDRMAEQALRRALQRNPADLEARALLACVSAAQLAEYELARESFGESDPELSALLESQTTQMQFVRGPRLLASPAAVLNEALEMSLDHKNNVVAQKIIEVMDRTGRRGASVLPSLTRAIGETPSRVVRVRAAIALSKWSSSGLSDRIGKLVVDVLGEAVVNSGIRTVHSIIGDPATASRLESLYRDLNLDSFALSSDVAAGLVRADNLPPDLLVIDQSASTGLSNRPNTAAINFFVNQIRGNARTAEIPIVVLALPSEAEAARNLYEDEDRKVVVLSTEVDAVSFRTAVLEPHFQDRDDAKARALAVAALAAEALSEISSRDSGLPVESAVSRLTQVVENRPDVVRVPCLQTLGNLRARAASSVSQIAQVFAATDNSVPVREAAMLAVARILDASGGQASDTVLKIIRDGMAEGQLALREASFIAFSAAGAPADQAVSRIFSTTTPDNPVTESGDDAGSLDEPSDDEPLDLGDDLDDLDLGDLDDL